MRRTMKLIKIDPQRINRCRGYLFPYEFLVKNEYGFDFNMEWSYQYIERYIKQNFTNNYDKWLPQDFFVNSVDHCPQYNHVMIVITSSEFEAVKEFEPIPLYKFLWEEVERVSETLFKVRIIDAVKME